VEGLDLDVVKTVVDDNGGAVLGGDVLTYTVTVTNEGATTPLRLFSPTTSPSSPGFCRAAWQWMACPFQTAEATTRT
jgi:hypothetical protein